MPRIKIKDNISAVTSDIVKAVLIKAVLFFSSDRKRITPMPMPRPAKRINKLAAEINAVALPISSTVYNLAANVQKKNPIRLLLALAAIKKRALFLKGSRRYAIKLIPPGLFIFKPLPYYRHMPVDYY